MSWGLKGLLEGREREEKFPALDCGLSHFMLRKTSSGFNWAENSPRRHHLSMSKHVPPTFTEGHPASQSKNGQGAWLAWLSG